ncbi:class 1 isoprenoid biosynthesis enzyme [Longitalea luteola]|uniref:class 1 isoprenoid biosynthesis enzyme n=1 Tax=Longitalea luteola TaxID=2812563 RepID=UPI001A968243|nr:class 1 isoprenoid biosynthesis enzyme [Longitalea luteola]
MTATGRGVSHHSSLQNHIPPSVSYFRILTRMVSLYRRVQSQEKLLKDQLPALLADIVPAHDKLFSAAHIKRITKYWQLALNLVCENLYQLSERQLQASEYKRIMLLSVFGPLFDDLFDDKILQHEQIAALVARPETYVAQNETDLLVTKLYLALLELTPNRQLFVHQLQQVSHWQIASLKQLKDNLTKEELQEITYNKSYYAILLFCAVLDFYPDQQLLEILYPVAGLMQLTNDAFDVWKDVQHGVYTLPNRYLNFEELQALFLSEIALINQKLWQLPYGARNKQSFAITVHSLHAMGWISLEQLKNVTAAISTYAELQQLSRKTLVCDMDSWQQKKKWLKQIRQFVNYYGSNTTPASR